MSPLHRVEHRCLLGQRHLIVGGDYVDDGAAHLLPWVPRLLDAGESADQSGGRRRVEAGPRLGALGRVQASASLWLVAGRVRDRAELDLVQVARRFQRIDREDESVSRIRQLREGVVAQGSCCRYDRL